MSLLQSGRINPVSRVCIATIQRVYSILKGEDLAPELEELSGFDAAALHREPAPVEYNPDIPIETFDVIITDECHRSIYNLWRQVRRPGAAGRDCHRPVVKGNDHRSSDAKTHLVLRGAGENA